MRSSQDTKVGDALLYTGSMLHGGGANETADQLRWALHLSVGGWLTPEEAIMQDIWLNSCVDAQRARPKGRALMVRPSQRALWLRITITVSEAIVNVSARINPYFDT